MLLSVSSVVKVIFVSFMEPFDVLIRLNIYNKASWERKMKRLVLLCFAFTMLFQSYSFCTEGIIYNPPIPKPKLSIEKALEIFRAKLKKDSPDGNTKLLGNYIVISMEYRSYNYIKEKYNIDTATMEKFSKEGNWEWIIKFSNTKISDDYQVYMVTQEGKVCAVEFCCL